MRYIVLYYWGYPIYLPSRNVRVWSRKRSIIQRIFLLEADPISLDIPSFIEKFEADNHITFGDAQKEAIQLSFFEKFSLITGGPGTGKTTIIKALVKGFQLGGLGRIILCAPTGRAAKRLTEATDLKQQRTSLISACSGQWFLWLY